LKALPLVQGGYMSYWCASGHDLLRQRFLTNINLFYHIGRFFFVHDMLYWRWIG
jgi:hypothetical protein